MPVGQKAFTGYLGTDSATWRRHDASHPWRARRRRPFPDGILIDQGLADKFLEAQLHPHLFEHACAAVKQPLTFAPPRRDTITASASSRPASAIISIITRIILLRG